jgi:hypothetical protein
MVSTAASRTVSSSRADHDQRSTVKLLDKRARHKNTEPEIEEFPIENHWTCKQNQRKQGTLRSRGPTQKRRRRRISSPTSGPTLSDLTDLGRALAAKRRWKETQPGCTQDPRREPGTSGARVYPLPECTPDPCIPGTQVQPAPGARESLPNKSPCHVLERTDV